MPDGPSSSYIARTAAVLQALAEQPAAGSIADLSRRLGLGRSAVHRVLQELVATGLAAYLPEKRMYQPGASAVELALLVLEWLPIRRIARPYLYELRDITEQPCALFLRMGSRYARVEQVLTQGTRTASALGQARALRYGATGRAILAFQPEPWVASYLDRLRSHPRGTAPGDDADWLRNEIEKIRRDGFSFSVGEFSAGFSTLAFPVRDALGTASTAVTLRGPADSWDESTVRRVVPECLGVIRRLETQIARGPELD